MRPNELQPGPKALFFLRRAALVLLLAAWCFVPVQKSGAQWINEIHYDNEGGDTGEFVEVAGPAGIDLAGWSIKLYNGAASSRKVYDTIALSGTLPDIKDGQGMLSFTRAGIQNGSPDGLALVDNANNVVEFLCYEGTFTADDGPATGTTCTDIGVDEDGSGDLLAAGNSLQRLDDGTWAGPYPATPGKPNLMPSYGSATVDGLTTDWDLAADFFADMFRAGKRDGSKDVESKLYLRYDCDSQKLYILVLSVNGQNVDLNEAWIKIYALGNGEQSFDEFAWVNSNGSEAEGWEGSILLAPGSYASDGFEVHLNFDGGETSSSGQKNQSEGPIALLLDCPTNGCPANPLTRFIWPDADNDGNADFTPSANGVVTIPLESTNGITMLELTMADNIVLLPPNDNWEGVGPSTTAFSGDLGYMKVALKPGAIASSDIAIKVAAVAQARSTFLIAVTDEISDECGIGQVDPVFDMFAGAEETPAQFTIDQNYPNPFNPTTSIHFDLPEATVVRLAVYDVMGREVTTLVRDEMPAGSHEVAWDGRDATGQPVASGAYFYRIEAGSFMQVRQMLLLK